MTAVVLLALAAGGGVTIPEAAAAAWPRLDTTLTVRETRGVARPHELVTIGVPVAARAGLVSTDGLQLTDAQGRVVDAQFRVTARWAGAATDASKPIRWLLVDFTAGVAAGGSETFRLTDRGQPAAPMPVTTTPDAWVVDTGRAQFTVPRGDGTLVSGAVVDGVEVLDAANSDHGSVLVTAADGTVLRSRDGRLLQAEITEQGPVKVVVHKQIELDAAVLKDETAENWTDPPQRCFSWLYDCARYWQKYYLRISVWETFVKGSSAARVRVRVENPDICVVDEGGAKHCYRPHTLESLAFEDLSLRLVAARPAATWRSSDAAGTTAAAVVQYQDSSGLDSWDYYTRLGGTWDRYPRWVSFRGYRTTVGGSTVAGGDTAPGWLALGEEGRVVGGAVGDMARSYPAALRTAAGGGSLDVSLFPAEWSRPHPLRAGEYNTEEAAFVVGGAPDAVALAHAWIEEPLRASWPVAYGVESGALDDLTVPGPSQPYERWNLVAIDPAAQPASTRRPNMLQTRDTFAMLGKVEHGFLPNDNEQETSTDLSKYGQYHGFLRQAVRLADRDPAHSDVWWETGTEALRALVDEGLLYQPFAYPGLWKGLNFAHCFHEDNEARTLPRGGGFGCDFSADVRGAAELYWLTGWEPAADFVREHTENVYVRASRGYLETFDQGARRWGSWIDTLIDGWEFTGDRRYYDKVVEVVGNLDASDAQPLACPCAGSTAKINSYFAGLLLRSLGRAAGMLVTGGDATSDAYATTVRVLDEWAGWYVDKVAFERYSAATGTTELIGPYYWNLDGQDNQSDPNVSSYRLMAVDGLALAHRHTGEQAYLDAARRMFDAVMRQHFYWAGGPYTWPVYTYSTINDHGKLAEFGGYFLAEQGYTITSHYTADEETLLAAAAQDLGTTPEEVQRWGTGVAAWLLSVLGAKSGPPVDDSGPASHTSRYTPAAYAQVTAVAGRLGYTPGQLQKLGGQVMIYLHGAGVV